MMHLKVLAKVSLLPVLCCMLFSGCKKEHGKEQITPVKKLWKITTSDGYSTVLNYNGQGKLIEVISNQFKLAPLTINYTFLYDNTGRLEEISLTGGWRHHFIYEENKLKLTENYKNLRKESENNFVFAGNKLVSNILFTPVAGTDNNIIYQPSYKKNYTYKNNGDIEQVATFGRPVSWTGFTMYGEKTIEQYDEHINPVEVLKYLYLVLNLDLPASKNIIKEKTVTVVGDLKELVENVFQYEKNGFPVSCNSTILDENGSTRKVTINYYYR